MEALQLLARGFSVALSVQNIGAALLGAVLVIPVLEPLFQVEPLSPGLLGAVLGLAAGSMAVIQLLKAVRRGCA